MTKCEKEFIRGYSCASAAIIRLHDEETIARDVAHEGLSLQLCIDAEVEEFDMEVLRPILTEKGKDNG